MNSSKQRYLQARLDWQKEKTLKLTEKLAALKKENQQINKRLKESIKLLNETPGAILVIQGDEVVFANNGLLNQMGYTQEETLGSNFLDHVHPDYVEYSMDIRRMLLSGKPVPDQFENYLVTKNGETICCEFRWKKIIYQSRKAFLFEILGLDERKNREKQLRQAEKTEALTRMASSLGQLGSHFLNNLGNSTRSLPGLSTVEDPALTEYLTMIHDIIAKGNFFTQQLESLSRMQYEKSGTKPCDLKHIVQEAVTATRPMWEGSKPDEAKITVKTYLRTFSSVRGRPEELKEACTNVIINAVDALPQGGEIYLTTEEGAGFASIYIQDNGVGIPESIIEKIFDPFFTTRKGSRLGLGLSLVQAVINRHGGEIEVLSQQGQGTTFIIKLPIAQKASSSVEKTYRNLIRNSHILIISDDDIITVLLSQLFLDKGGKVSVAPTGQAGLNLLKKEKIDMVLADMNVPYFKSLKLIPKIKDLDPDLPIAVMNVDESENSANTFRELGAELVFRKPLLLDSITEPITKAIAMKE